MSSYVHFRKKFILSSVREELMPTARRHTERFAPTADFCRTPHMLSFVVDTGGVLVFVLVPFVVHTDPSIPIDWAAFWFAICLTIMFIKGEALDTEQAECYGWKVASHYQQRRKQRGHESQFRPEYRSLDEQLQGISVT